MEDRNNAAGQWTAEEQEAAEKLAASATPTSMQESVAQLLELYITLRSQGFSMLEACTIIAQIITSGRAEGDS